MDTSNNHFIPADFLATRNYISILNDKDGLTAKQWLDLTPTDRIERFSQWKASNKPLVDFGLTLDRFMDPLKPIDYRNLVFTIESLNIIKYSGDVIDGPNQIMVGPATTR